MLPQWIIEKKRDGATLSPSEIRGFIDGYCAGTIPDYQMAALAMAIYFRGMSPAETAELTFAMMASGKTIDPRSIPGTKVDKHSTGGIGDKVSIPLAPLVASCGAVVPMVSGRGLGITGGTLDKLESIPGYRVALAESEFLDVLQRCGCSMIGQTAEIAPADKMLYALRDVTATVPSIPLIVSSIMSKKLAEGIDSLVLDVKCGSGAFMKTIEEARALARALVDTGTAMGRKTVACITRMDQPLGRCVGNALEIRESIDILQGKGPSDTRELTLLLAERMLGLAGCNHSDPVAALDGGAALDTFRNMVRLHGGDPDAELPVANHLIPLPSPASGHISRCDAETIGKACLLLGAGRTKTTDAIDHAVGLSGLKKIGETVEQGEPFCIVHSNGHENENDLMALLASAFHVSGNPLEPPPLLLEEIV